MRRSRFAFGNTFGIFALIACPLVASAQPMSQPPKLDQPSAAAISDYSEAGSLQNSREFDLAAERWENFLTKHPSTTLTPKAQHYCGVCYLQSQQFAKAAEHFNVVVTKWSQIPDFNLLEDAFLNLGWCHYQLGLNAESNEKKVEHFQQAAGAFNGLVRQFPKPNGKYVDQGLYFLAESLYRYGEVLAAQANELPTKEEADAARQEAEKQKQQSIVAYSQLIKDHPESNLRENALYSLGVTHEELGQYSDAAGVYDTFMTEFPDSDLFTEVKMRKAETVLQAGLAAEDEQQANAKFAQAAKMFGETAAVEGFAMADHALFQQALCAFHQEKFAEAANLYAQVATDFPNSVYVPEATLNAGRFFYRGGSYPEALQWLQKAVDANQPEAPEAAHWICRIHLQNGEPAKAAALAERILPKAEGSEYLVNLKMDQADAQYEVAGKKAESLPLYVAIGTEHPNHELAPQAWYNAAFTALELNQYQDALNYTATFLENHPEHSFVPDAKYIAAECNLLMGNLAEAETDYRDVISNHAGHQDIQLWQVRLGLCLYMQEKYAETIEHLSPLVAELKQPENVAEGHFLLGASQFYTGKYDAAAKQLAASLQAAPNWSKADETTLLWSWASFKLDNVDEAIATIKQMIANFPDSKLLGQAHYRYGEYAYAKGDHKTAIAEYTSVIEDSPQSPYAPFSYYGKGWAQMKNEQYGPAAETFTGLLTEFPQHNLAVDTQFARGMCRRQTDDHQGAVEDLTAFLETGPGQPDKSNALYELGLAHQKLKNYEAAAGAFASILEENPESPIADKVIYELAWALKDDGKEEEALAKFSQLATQHPDSPLAAEAHFHFGEDLYAKGEYEPAAEQYAAAKAKAKVNDLSEKAIYKLGFSYFQQQQYTKALEEFQEQVESHPQGKLNPDGLFMVAECQYKLDDFAQAYPAYAAAKAAIDAKEGVSDNVKVLILLHGGTSAVETGKQDEALTMLQEIPTNFPDSPLLPEAYFEIGRALKGQEKYNEAVAELEKAYDHAGAQGKLGLRARARFEIGEILFAQQKHDAATKEFRLVMSGFGQNPPDDVKQWQALAGYEAGRCAFVRIKGETNPQARAKLIADAKNFYGYVVKNHPDSTAAASAQEDLEVLAQL